MLGRAEGEVRDHALEGRAFERAFDLVAPAGTSPLINDLNGVALLMKRSGEAQQRVRRRDRGPKVQPCLGIDQNNIKLKADRL